MANLPASNLVSEHLGAQWISKNSDFLSDNFYKEQVFKRYAKGVTYLDILESARRIISIPAQDMKIVEETFPERPIIVRDQIATGNAGASVTLYLHADNYDVNGKCPLRLYQTVLIPQYYQQAGVTDDRLYWVSALAQQVLPNDAVTLIPFDNGVDRVKSKIDVAIPALTELMIGPFAFARGTDQPEPTTNTNVTRTLTTGIVKETKGFEGGAIAHAFQVPGMEGQGYLINKESIDAEFRLEAHKDKMITYGQENDNASLVMLSGQTGAYNTVKSTKGIHTWADEASQRQYYNNNFAITDLKTNRLVQESQDNYSNTCTIFCGSKLAQDLYDSCMDYIKEYSGGSDFIDKTTGRIGFTPKVLTYGGVDYYISPVMSLSNPSTYGMKDANDAYRYRFNESALIIPDTKVTVPQWGDKNNYTIPTLALGYVDHNGENRRNMMGIYAGMNGVLPGDRVATGVDGWKYFWSSEFMVIVAEVNKWVYWRKAI
jgi:hypothetical protein